LRYVAVFCFFIEERREGGAQEEVGCKEGKRNDRLHAVVVLLSMSSLRHCAIGCIRLGLRKQMTEFARFARTIQIQMEKEAQPPEYFMTLAF
jgi:hypothetical protein